MVTSSEKSMVCADTIFLLTNGRRTRDTLSLGAGLEDGLPIVEPIVGFEAPSRIPSTSTPLNSFQRLLSVIDNSRTLLSPSYGMSSRSRRGNSHRNSGFNSVPGAELCKLSHALRRVCTPQNTCARRDQAGDCCPQGIYRSHSLRCITLESDFGGAA